MNSMGTIFPVTDMMNASVQSTFQVKMANGIARRNSPKGAIAVRKVRTKSISISADSIFHRLCYVLLLGISGMRIETPCVVIQKRIDLAAPFLDTVLGL